MAGSKPHRTLGLTALGMAVARPTCYIPVYRLASYYRDKPVSYVALGMHHVANVRIESTEWTYDKMHGWHDPERCYH